MIASSQLIVALSALDLASKRLQIGAGSRLAHQARKMLVLGHRRDCLREISGNLAESRFEERKNVPVSRFASSLGQKFLNQRRFDHGTRTSENGQQSGIIMMKHNIPRAHLF